MSERGSFVTEVIICDKCRDAAHQALSGLSGREVSTRGHLLSGRIDAMSSGAELFEFDEVWVVELSRVLCHPLRVAVLAEDGQQIFVIHPRCESATALLCALSQHTTFR